MSAGTAIGESSACAISVQAIIYGYKYQEGSIVYSINKAKKGILEAIAIRSVRIFINKKTFGQTGILYIDTYNGIWNEYDLCNESEAKNFALAYLQNLQTQLQAEIERCH